MAKKKSSAVETTKVTSVYDVNAAHTTRTRRVIMASLVVATVAFPAAMLGWITVRVLAMIMLPVLITMRLML